MRNMKKIFYLTIFALVLSGCSTLTGGSGSQIIGDPSSITMWVVVDSPSDYRSVIELYNQKYPNIRVTVKKFRLEDYEDELVNAIAEDRGPDVFMVHNTWIRKYLSKIDPLPPQITLPQAISTGAIKKEIVIRQTTTNTISALDVKNKFVDVVADDVIINNEIFSLPLYVDTLALYYNRSLLNSAGIAQPPVFWDQFLTASSQLTKISADNVILQAGSSLGTSNNVENAADLLTLLMIQNGTKMTTDSKTAATFHTAPPEDRNANPSAEALRFYTDFALPQTTAYTWNKDKQNNLEAFTNGELAFFLGYAYHLPLIKSQTLGKLNFSVAPILQIQGRPPANIASYWTPVVSKKAKSRDAAWSLLQHMASTAVVPEYLKEVKKPTALLSLIDAEKTDADLFAFSGQALNAQNWYYGVNPKAAKNAFNQMITDAVVIDPSRDRITELRNLISSTAAVVNQSYR